MIFRDWDETETRNLDREMREIENETRISWWISRNFTLKTRDSRREFFISLFSRPRRDRDFCKMIFRDRDETETRNLDREMREIENETRISWWISRNFTLKTRDSRREFFISLFSRPRRDRDFCKMIFRDRDETETRNLDREIREIETETRVSSNPVVLICPIS